MGGRVVRDRAEWRRVRRVARPPEEWFFGVWSTSLCHVCITGDEGHQSPQVTDSGSRVLPRELSGHARRALLPFARALTRNPPHDRRA